MAQGTTLCRKEEAAVGTSLTHVDVAECVSRPRTVVHTFTQGHQRLQRVIVPPMVSEGHDTFWVPGFPLKIVMETNVVALEMCVRSLPYYEANLDGMAKTVEDPWMMRCCCCPSQVIVGIVIVIHLNIDMRSVLSYHASSVDRDHLSVLYLMCMYVRRHMRTFKNK